MDLVKKLGLKNEGDVTVLADFKLRLDKLLIETANKVNTLYVDCVQVVLASPSFKSHIENLVKLQVQNTTQASKTLHNSMQELAVLNAQRLDSLEALNTTLPILDTI